MKVYKDKELAKEVEKDVPILLLYHMKGCGGCEMFKPTWKEIKNELKGETNIKLGEIEVKKLKVLPENLQNIFAVPSIQIIKKGKKISEYVGNRSKEDVLKYARKYTKSKKKNI